MTVQGNCAGVPAPADLETTLDPPRESIDQCIIVAAAPLLEIYNAATLLLSDVYIMLKREAPDASALLLPLISIPSGSLWMTNSVLRGDVSNCRGVHVGFGQHFHSSSAPNPFPSPARLPRDCRERCMLPHVSTDLTAYVTHQSRAQHMWHMCQEHHQDRALSNSRAVRDTAGPASAAAAHVHSSRHSVRQPPTDDSCT